LGHGWAGRHHGPAAGAGGIEHDHEYEYEYERIYA
jgi:hypothetical protein